MLHNAVDLEATRSVRPGSFKISRMPYQSLEHTLEQMKALVQNYRGNLSLRDKAVQITSGIAKDSRTNLPNRRDYHALALAVYAWMKANIQYVRDPYQVELLQSPLKTLEVGYGDCDDQSILAAALLSSLGVPTQFKVVKADPNQPNNYTHVYVVYQANGQWLGFDPTLHSTAGDELSDSQIFGQKFITLADASPHKPCNCKEMSRLALSIAPVPIYDIKNGTIINDDGLGSVVGATVVAGQVASVAQGAFNAVKGLFGGGDQGPERRGRKRQALADLGFTYENKSGHQDRHYTNIENFDDAGLDNIARAADQYGVEVVRDMHNAGLFNKDTAANYGVLSSIIEKNLPAANSSFIPSAASFSTASLSPTIKYVGGGLLAMALFGTAYSMFNNAKPAKK